MARRAIAQVLQHLAGRQQPAFLARLGVGGGWVTAERQRRQHGEDEERIRIMEIPFIRWTVAA